MSSGAQLHGDVYPVLSINYIHEEDGVTVEGHDIPVQAVADRMELLGLESFEQTLEYIGREWHNSQVSDTLHAPMQAAYADVAQSEFAQSLMPHPLMDNVGRQTLMAPLSIAQEKRQKLAAVRDDVLSKLGMKSVIHSEPMFRVMDTSRPMEHTRPAAAEALKTPEEVVQEAVRLLQERVDMIQAWRVETACAHVPQLRQKLEQEMEKK